MTPAAAGAQGRAQSPAAEAWTTIPIAEVARGERRLDGEAYLTPGYAIRRNIERVLPHKRFTEVALVWLPNRLKGVAVRAHAGTPFLAATQVFDIHPKPRKWLAPSKTPKHDEMLVEEGWILVTRSGTVGEAIVAYAPHLGKVVSDDLLRIQPYDREDRGYVYVFLRCRHGKHMLRSSRYGSIVKHLEASHLNDVPLPVVSGELKQEFSKTVRDIYRLRTQAYVDTRRSETLISEALSAPEQLSTALTYTVRSQDMFVGRRRLEAYHYNRAAAEAEQVVRGNARKTVPLADVTQDIFGVPRFKHVYAESGIPYLDSEDLFKINPEITKFIPAATKKKPESYFVKRGWVLLACSGQLYGLNGTAALAGQWHERKIISNHALRIVPNSEARPGFIEAILNHPVVGRPLVLRYAFGSEVPEIAPEDIRDFPVPRLAPSIEDEVADAVEGAAEQRERANALELEAVSRLEEWLDQRIGGFDA